VRARPTPEFLVWIGYALWFAALGLGLIALMSGKVHTGALFFVALGCSTVLAVMELLRHFTRSVRNGQTDASRSQPDGVPDVRRRQRHPGPSAPRPESSTAVR